MNMGTLQPSINITYSTIYQRVVTNIVTDVYQINTIPDDIIETRAVIVTDTRIPITSANFENKVYESCYQLMLEELNQYHNEQLKQKQRDHEQLVKMIEDKLFLYRNIIDAKHKQHIKHEIYKKQYNAMIRKQKIRKAEIRQCKRALRDWKDDWESREIEIWHIDNKIYRIERSIETMEDCDEKNTLILELSIENKNERMAIKRHNNQHNRLRNALKSALKKYEKIQKI
jgi:hypothetical protein